MNGVFGITKIEISGQTREAACDFRRTRRFSARGATKKSRPRGAAFEK